MRGPDRSVGPLSDKHREEHTGMGEHQRSHSGEETTAEDACVPGCAHASHLCGTNQRPSLTQVPPLSSAVQDGDRTLSLAQGGWGFSCCPVTQGC